MKLKQTNKLDLTNFDLTTDSLIEKVLNCLNKI